MKMPWYSAYADVDSSSRSTRYRPSVRINHQNVTVRMTTSSYSTPSSSSFRHSTRNPSPGSPRRTSFHFNLHRPTAPDRTPTYRTRYQEPAPSYQQRDWTGHGATAGRSRHWDAATERLFARADALTERLQRLLAKSADLRWRTTSTTTIPSRSADARPDIFSSRVSQPRSETDPGSPRSSAKTRSSSGGFVDSLSKAERPPPKTHVITIKLSNSYSNRTGSNHRYNHRNLSDSARRAAEKARDGPDQPPPQPPPPPPPPRERHRTTFHHFNVKEPAGNKESTTDNSQHEDDETEEEPQAHETHFRHSTYTPRYYARASSGPRKTPVVRVIPIYVEADSGDEEVVTTTRTHRIDPERDIQEPDCEPIVTSPAPSKSSSITLEIPSRLIVEELDDREPEVGEFDFTSEAQEGQRALDSTPSCNPTRRRQALALSLAEEKKEEGNMYYKLKDYRKALACYTRAIELCPTNVAYYGNRSACRLMLNMFQHALEDARESIHLDPNFAKGYVRIAKCCLALGDAAAALNAVNKAEELDPSTNLTVEKRSLNALQQHVEDMESSYAKGDYRRVVYCCDRALEHASASRRIKLTKAECLALLGRYQEAEELANDILRLDQNNPDALLVRGLCLYYQDNIDKAFAHFKQVLVMAPDHAKARDVFRKAKMLKAKKEEGNEAFKAGRYQEALDLYDATLSIDPNNKLTNAKVYFNRAVVLVKLGKLKEAETDCDKAIELDETYVKAYLRRAKIFMDLEQFEDAVRDYEKVNKMEKNREYKRLLHEAKVALKRSQRKDYYKILGVDRNANEDEIKKAYKKRALVHHPDRHSSATEEEKKEQEKKFKELGEAYGILSDPKKKSRYDNGADLDDLDSGYSNADMDPNQIFQAFFGGPNMFRMGGMGGGMGGHCPGGFSFQFG